jgi:hypothetical protein
MGVALQLDKMSLAEKIQTMEILWDDLCHHVQDVSFPEWHLEVITSRETDLRDGKERFTDWETAKESIRESIK